MRTNIEIDAALLREAMEAANATTKKAAVEAALRLVVQLKRQEAIKDLFGMVHWEGNLDEMRMSRFPDWDNRPDCEPEAMNEPAA